MVVYFPDVGAHVFDPFGRLGGEAGQHDWSVIGVLLKGTDDGTAEARRCAACNCYENHEDYDTARPFWVLKSRSVVKASSCDREELPPPSQVAKNINSFPIGTPG
jgi:hypothetical protein